MATCPSCAGTSSADATPCPGCGDPLRAPRASSARAPWRCSSALVLSCSGDDHFATDHGGVFYSSATAPFPVTADGSVPADARRIP